MEVTLETVAAQVSEISKQLETIGGIEGRLTAHASKLTDEIKHQARIHKEELKDEVKKAAEGYDATLRKIEGELSDLNAKVGTGFHDHDLVLKDHNERILKLEQNR
jgi:hypothetical protein